MRQVFVAAAASAVAVFSIGCGSSGSTVTSTPPTPPTPPSGTYAGSSFGGKVMAGITPVVGATVQVYAAGTTGNGSAPSQVLASALTTDATGSFSVAAGYECPVAASVVFIVAAGGHAGGSGSSNGATELVSSPGACNSITTGASYVLNEVTTVGSAYAFAQFLKTGAQLGASSTNTSGITLAAGTLANLVNITTGAAQGAAFPATGTSPATRINALANVLNACVVSSGVASTACANLFTATTAGGVTPGNTLDAVLNLVHHPGTNVATVFGLTSGAAAYSPALSAAPKDWVMFVPYTGGGMSEPSDIALDSTGRVWVGNYNSVASLFTNTGAPVFASGVTGNGLYESYGMTVDASDNAWFANEQSPGVGSGFGTVTELSSTGQSLSGTTGYSQGGLNFPIAIAFDSTGIAWVADYGNSHLTLLNSSGVPQSGSSGYSGSQLQLPVAIAVDSNRNGWLADFPADQVTKVSADGSTITAYACTAGPTGVAVDGSNNVWVTGYFGNSVTLLSSSGTNLSGGGFTGGGLNYPQEVAIDGSGVAWIANYRGPSLTELASVASGNAGAALSPAAGWGPDANLEEAFGIAIDASGNIWVSGFGNNTLTEFVGLATPVKTPLIGPVRVP
jgi:hypothetical protein